MGEEEDNLNKLGNLRKGKILKNIKTKVSKIKYLILNDQKKWGLKGIIRVSVRMFSFY